MPLVSFYCPSCGQSVSVDAPAGTQARCGLCQAVVVVPFPASTPADQAPPRAPTAQAAAPPIRTGLSTASLVCGILGLLTFCFPIVGLVGVILGIVALVQVHRSPDLYGGKGAAIGGVSTGTVSLVACPLFLMLVIPFFMEIEANTQRLSCSGNLRMISRELMSYAADHDDTYPPGFATVVEDGNLWPFIFRCPAADDDENVMRVAAGNPVDEGDLRRCYEYLEGQRRDGPRDNVLIVELPHCHEDGGHVVFADGRVEFIEPYEKVEQLFQQTRARIARAARDPATQPVRP